MKAILFFVLIFSIGFATTSIGQVNFSNAGMRVESNSSVHGLPKSTYTVAIYSDDSFDIAFEKIKNHLIDYGFKIKTSDKNRGTITTTIERIKYWSFTSQLNVDVIKKGEKTKIEIKGKDESSFGEGFYVESSIFPISVRGISGRLLEMVNEVVFTYDKYEDDTALTNR